MERVCVYSESMYEYLGVVVAVATSTIGGAQKYVPCVPQLTREDSSSGSLDDVDRYRSDTNNESDVRVINEEKFLDTIN